MTVLLADEVASGDSDTINASDLEHLVVTIGNVVEASHRRGAKSQIDVHNNRLLSTLITVALMVNIVCVVILVLLILSGVLDARDSSHHSGFATLNRRVSTAIGVCKPKSVGRSRQGKNAAKAKRNESKDHENGKSSTKREKGEDGEDGENGEDEENGAKNGVLPKCERASACLSAVDAAASAFCAVHVVDETSTPTSGDAQTTPARSSNVRSNRREKRECACSLCGAYRSDDDSADDSSAACSNARINKCRSFDKNAPRSRSSSSSSSHAGRVAATPGV